MRLLTSVDLALSWSAAAPYLSRRWRTALDPYLSQEQSSIMSSRFIFASDDPFLAEFLAFAEPIMVYPSGSSVLLDRFRGTKPEGPLLRLVRSWREYDFVDLQHEPVVQLLLDRTIELTPPLSQYYRIAIEPDADCARCGEKHLHQQHSLRVHGPGDPGMGMRGDDWQAGDQIAATENFEIVISQHLRTLWESAAAPDHPQFLAVEHGDAGQPLWQAMPQGTAHVLTPATPLQVRDRCPACGRPLTVALSMAPSGAAFGPGRRTVYEQEALLTVDSATLPAGDLWVTDLQEGRVRELIAILQGFEDYPDPFFVRTSRPFWLISQRLLRVLHEHVASGWRCRPVNGLT